MSFQPQAPPLTGCESPGPAGLCPPANRQRRAEMHITSKEGSSLMRTHLLYAPLIDGFEHEEPRLNGRTAGGGA
jgi:hypothetical protein